MPGGIRYHNLLDTPLHVCTSAKDTVAGRTMTTNRRGKPANEYAYHCNIDAFYYFINVYSIRIARI